MVAFKKNENSCVLKHRKTFKSIGHWQISIIICYSSFIEWRKDKLIAKKLRNCLTDLRILFGNKVTFASNGISHILISMLCKYSCIGWHFKYLIIRLDGFNVIIFFYLRFRVIFLSYSFHIYVFLVFSTTDYLLEQTTSLCIQ